MSPALPRRAVTELIGTFLLVWFGCGAMMVNADTGLLTHPGVAAAWGAIVAILIYAIGDVSGAHLNPAVSIAFVASKRFAAKDAVVYVIAQCAGSLLAAVTLVMTIPDAGAWVGSTTTDLPLGSGWLVEAMMTAVLMFVIMGVSTGAKEKSITAGLAIGSTIGLEALVAGPLTKASMNPARSLGPALVSKIAHQSGPPIEQLWLYLSAPIVGALVGLAVYRFIRAESTADA